MANTIVRRRQLSIRTSHAIFLPKKTLTVFRRSQIEAEYLSRQRRFLHRSSAFSMFAFKFFGDFFPFEGRLLDKILGR